MKPSSEANLLNAHCASTLERVARYFEQKPMADVHGDQEPPTAFFMQLPLPAWIKREDGTMHMINPAYGRVYGVDPAFYTGADEVYWGKGAAAGFDETDRAAMSAGSAFAVEEAPHPVSKEMTRILVFKYRMDVMTADGPARMIGGIAVTHWSREWWGDGKERRAKPRRDPEAVAGPGSGTPKP